MDWGHVHQVQYGSLLERSGNPLMIWRYGVEPIQARGENFTINAGSFSYAEPFSMPHGTSQREVIDRSDLDGMQVINGTGQSDLALHSHRTDLIKKWQNIAYIPLPFRRERVAQNTATTLTLTPEDSR